VKFQSAALNGTVLLLILADDTFLCLNLNFPVRLKVTKKAVFSHAEDNGLICSKEN
jgi:hypothetical protein